MSRVEKSVTSLEVSRKLKDLGIIQESCFYWVYIYVIHKYEWFLSIKINESYVLVNDSSIGFSIRNGSFFIDAIESSEPKEIISAFTVTELGAMWKKENIIDTLVHFDPNYTAQELYEYFMSINEKNKWIERYNQNLKRWRGDE